MKKKADQIVGEFAANMSRKLAEGGDVSGAAPSTLVTDAAVAEGGRASPSESETPEQVS
jgi:hypothetical protein